MLKPLIIGIAGGSGSGKSTVARNVAELLTTSSVAFIDMDAYYKNFPELSLGERRKLNWDHPDAFDYDLLCMHLEALSKRKAIDKPHNTVRLSKQQRARIRRDRATIKTGHNFVALDPRKIKLLCATLCRHRGVPETEAKLLLHNNFL